MRFVSDIICVVLLTVLSGCSQGGGSKTTIDPLLSTSTAPNGSSTSSSGGESSTSSSGSESTTVIPSTTVTATLPPTPPPTSNCPGKRLGQYTWGTELWREGTSELSDFFATEGGKEWGCGDLTINIGDYTAPEVIAYVNDLIPFIKRYRQSSQNYESIVWLSYGDTMSGDGNLMLQFIDTFFAWAQAIPTESIGSLGKIGLSFDVEHMTPASTKSALEKVQSLKSTTRFAPGYLLVQHTIEGNTNTEGTDYVMKYADSALMMLYRNYETSPIFHGDSNILSRAKWMLQTQCPNCLNDRYAKANYKAKITIMVEGSCAQFDYCAKLSFCVYDGSSDSNFSDPKGRTGAAQTWGVLQDLNIGMFSSGLINEEQFARLFNQFTTFAVHDWTWFRCYEPFPKYTQYSQCSTYHQAAQQCRAQLGPLPSTPAP